MKVGMQCLMDLGLNQSIKKIRYKYFPHPSFNAIIHEMLLESLETLKNATDDAICDNCIKHWLAFAHGENYYFELLIEHF